LKFVMARDKSTAHFVGATAGSGGEGHESEGSVEGTESAQLSDVGSHSGVGGDVDEGSHTRSYLFEPSTVTVSRIRGMVNNGYFVEGRARECGEETVLEPNPDEAMVYEFLTAGLRMPPHPVLADMLLKFQVQLHHLTPNAMVQLSKYIL
jgi:hypothetical protein